MDRSSIASDGRSVRPVSEGHDVLLLSSSPCHELLYNLALVEVGVVSKISEVINVIALELNHLFEGGQSILLVRPFLEVSSLLLFAGDLDGAKDHIASVPSLGIKHVEGNELVLHTDIHEFGVLFEDNSLVTIVDPKLVGRL